MSSDGNDDPSPKEQRTQPMHEARASATSCSPDDSPNSHASAPAGQPTSPTSPDNTKSRGGSKDRDHSVETKKKVAKEGRSGKDDKENKENKESDKKEGDTKKSRKSGSSRSRRERRERHAAQMSMYGWEGDPAMWDYNNNGNGYQMDYDLAAMGVDPMALDTMALDPYLNPMNMPMGMGNFMNPMGAFGEGGIGFPQPTPAAAAKPASSAKAKPAEGKGASEGLSIHAKPWSPPAESTHTTVTSSAPPHPKDNRMDINPASWTTIEGVNGAPVAAPVSMTPSDASNNNVFVHSFSVIPRSHPDVELNFFFYKCARCPLRTLYGRLSSRRADITITNVAPDVPPMCLAHLLEQVAKVRVTAIVASHVNQSTQYDMWLDKASMAPPLITSLAGVLWMCPFAHGFAVVARTDSAKAFLNEYLTTLREDPKAEDAIYPLACVDVREY